MGCTDHALAHSICIHTWNANSFSLTHPSFNLLTVQPNVSMCLSVCVSVCVCSSWWQIHKASNTRPLWWAATVKDVEDTLQHHQHKDRNSHTPPLDFSAHLLTHIPVCVCVSVCVTAYCTLYHWLTHTQTHTHTRASQWVKQQPV